MASRSGTVAALDVGSSKICCFIARLDEDGRPRVTGIGHQVSRGVRSGTIIDMEQAEAVILSAVHAAEEMAGETIQEVIVNLSGGYPASQTVGVEVQIAGHEIGDGDLRRVLEQGSMVDANGERRLIHSIPIRYSIDGSSGIRDPRGMFGERLGVDMHVVTAQAGAVRNLANCIARCHLEIGALVVSPYAAGLASLVDDERDLGVTVIDMGGGATTISVFFDGNVVYTDIVPVGGAHVTNDIARGLSTPLAHAERLKTLYGNCMLSPSDEREMITVPLVGEEDAVEGNTIARSMLVGIIQPRLEETFELVRQRLEQSGFDKIAGRRVVLTGGASQLAGLRELASGVLDKQVRMGRPIRIAGLAEATGGPAFATAAGLLVYAQQAFRRLPRTEAHHQTQQGEAAGFIGRLGNWLRVNF
jgi:cell division protein FtsA